MKTYKNAAQVIVSVVSMAVCFACVSSSAFALTKEELLSYSAGVKNIAEENLLQLPPGSLKKTPLSQEERQQRIVALAGLMGGTTDTNWRETLSYYMGFFSKGAERLSREVETADRDLVEWNKKLIAGYRDSYEVTRLAASLLKAPDMGSLHQALRNKDLMKRIYDNMLYHQGIQSELESIIRTSFPADPEVQRLPQEIAGVFVESTWK